MACSILAFLFLLVSLKASVIITLNQAQHGAYSQWKSQYSRSYQSSEVEGYRLTLWLQNYNLIEAHNAKFQQGLVSYSVAVNQFADMPSDQISSFFFGQIDDSQYISMCTPHQEPVFEGDSYHHNIDYPIPNQRVGSNICGSGWAMATSTTLSIAYSNHQRLMKNSTIIYTASVQQVMDCSYNTNGCMGGSVFNAWAYYEQFGVVFSSIYPYTAIHTSCNTTKTPAFQIDDCISVSSSSTQSSESSLRYAVAVSPVTVQINGDSWGFTYYSGGVFDGSDCNDVDINHSLTIVGFDYEIDFNENGPYNLTYWVAINSFGTSWGESGKVRMLRTVDDTSSGPCGMYLYPSYPIF